MRATTLLFSALALSSCARAPQQPFGGAVAPQVAFQHASVEALRAGSIDTRFTLAVHNPFPYAVDMEPIAWTIELAGVQELTGTTEGAEFGRRQAASVAIPVHRDWEQLAPALEAIGESDNIPFVLTGTAYFDTPEGRIEVPILAEGQLPVVLPPPLATLVDVREIGGGELPSLQLLLDTEGFPRDVERVSYRVWLGYDLVTDGATAPTWVDDRLALPIVVDAPAMSTLRDGAELRVEVTADVRTPHGVVPVVLNAGGDVDLDDRRL